MNVTVWDDPTNDTNPDAIGWFSFDADLFWTPRIGPTSLLAGRRLFTAAHTGADVDLAELGQALGVRSHTRIRNTVTRLHRYGLIADTSAGIAVRNMLPPLNRTQVGALPDSIRALWIAQHPEKADVWGVTIPTGDSGSAVEGESVG